MTATILSEAVLPHLPSASGVEIIGLTAYIVSDDAPYLYRLDAATLAPAGQVPLFETTDFDTGRIPKATKPDLESLAASTGPGGAAGLLLCGSGSGPNREVGYFVGLPTAPATPPPLRAAPRPSPAAGAAAAWHHPQPRSRCHLRHRAAAVAARARRAAGRRCCLPCRWMR